MARFFVKQSFLIALALSFTLGCFLSPEWVQWIGGPTQRMVIVFSVMLAMGITLEARSMGRSIKQPTAILIAVGANILLVPLLVLPSQVWLSQELFGGLMVAALVPCTLASAAVWTRRGRGDDAIALMTTMVTNIACVVVIPVGLWLLERSGVLQLPHQAGVDPVSQLKRLVFIVVVPLGIAQFLRYAGFAHWADQRKRGFSLVGQVGILLMVLIGASRIQMTLQQAEMVQTSSYSLASWWMTLVTLVTASSVHLLAFGIALRLAWAANLPPDQQIACGIGGSQKTLMVGLQIAIDCGVSILPMMLYHLVQLMLDTLIVQWWSGRHKNQ